MDTRQQIISDIRRTLISLYMTYGGMDDLTTKMEILRVLLGIVNDDLIDSLETEEEAYALRSYLVDEVNFRFGKEGNC